MFPNRIVKLEKSIFIQLAYGIAILILCLNTIACEGNTHRAKLLLEKIKREGAGMVLEKDLSGENWTYLISRMEAGDEEWLKVGAGVFPASDGGPAETLANAAGEALKRNATAVLRVGPPNISIESICDYSEATVVHHDYKTLKEALEDVDLRISSVQKISDPTLTNLRGKCIDTLKKGRNDIQYESFLFKRN